MLTARFRQTVEQNSGGRPRPVDHFSRFPQSGLSQARVVGNGWTVRTFVDAEVMALPETDTSPQDGLFTWENCYKVNQSRA